MTKTWEEVREEICRLYAEGRSLEYIRKTLQRQRHFQASTRAFRLKLKAWKVKRSDAASAFETGQHALPYAYLRQVSASHVSPSLAVDQSSGTHSPSRSTNGATLGPVADHRSLEDLYLQLRNTNPQSGQEQGPVIRTCDFVDGTTSILHFAIKEPASEGNTTFTERLLHDMRYHKISVDTRDRKGRTALELAIRKDSSSLTKLLLDHGANPNQQDSQGYTPLHVALKAAASPGVVHVLLRRGADPNTCFPAMEESRTALERIANTLRSTESPSNVGYLKYFKIVGALLEHGAGWSTNELKDILASFIYYWDVSSGSPLLFESAELALCTYLEAGLDPVGILRRSTTASLHPVSRPVTDLTKLCSPSASLALFIIQKTKVRDHLRTLVVKVILQYPLSPNSSPLPEEDAQRVLRSAIEHMDSSTPETVIRRSEGLLMAAIQLSQDHWVASNVHTIASAKPDECRFDSHPARHHFVQSLVGRPAVIRYRIAESVLLRRDGVDDPGSLPEMMRDAKRLAYQADPMAGIENRVRRFLRKFYCAEQEMRSFFLCVLHVVTKDILENESWADPQAREMLIGLVRTRQLNGLPDLAISQKALYTAFSDASSGSGIDESVGCSVM